jgi:hypothetical protein
MLRIHEILEHISQIDWPDGESLDALKRRLSHAELESNGYVEINIFKPPAMPGMLTLKIRKDGGELVGMVKDTLPIDLSPEAIDSFVRENAALGYFEVI